MNHSLSDRAVSSESKDFVFNLLVMRKGWYRCPSTGKDEQSTIASLQQTCQLHSEPHIFAESSSLMKPHLLSVQLSLPAKHMQRGECRGNENTVVGPGMVVGGSWVPQRARQEPHPLLEEEMQGWGRQRQAEQSRSPAC